MNKRIFLIIAMAFFSLTSFTAGEVNNVSTPVFNAEPPAGGPPVILSYSPETITAKEHQTVLLYLMCSSSEHADIEVFKNGIAVPVTSKITLSVTNTTGVFEITVKIPDLALEDSGEYTIKITNKSGSITKNFTVTVTL